MSRPVGFILQGVGSLAAYEAGVSAALCRAGLLPRFVAGSAMGALNAAVIAGNPPERIAQALEALWQGLAGLRLGEDEGAREIGQLLRSVDFERLNRGEVRFAIAACSVASGRLRIFSNRHMTIAPEHVIASAQAPPNLTAVDGELYWGAGYVGFTAAAVMGFLQQDLPRTRTPIGLVQLRFEGRATPRTPEEAAERYTEILYWQSSHLPTGPDLDYQVDREAQRSSARAATPSSSWTKFLRRIEVPHTSLSGAFDFSPDALSRRFAVGLTEASHLDLYADLPPLVEPALAPVETYRTVLRPGDDLPEFQIAFAPAESGFRLPSDIPLQPLPSLEHLRQAIVAQLSAGTPGPVGPSARLEEIASAILYDVRIPVAQSPLKGWSLVSILGATGLANAHLLSIDPSSAPLIVLEMAGSLVLLGAANVVKRAFDGYAKSAEEAGLALGRRQFRAMGVTPGKPTAGAAKPRRRPGKKAPPPEA